MVMQWCEDLAIESILYIAFGVFSVVLCLVAVVMVFRLKLYRTLLYRLTIYQTISAAVYGIVLVSVGCSKRGTDFNVIVDAVFYYFGWMKATFTMCLMVHLFVYIILDKNMKRLEPLYIIGGLVIPIPMAGVPFAITFSNVSRNDSIEREMATYIPAMTMLFLSSIAACIVGLKLCYRVFHKKEDLLLTVSILHKQALCEALPLISYPIIFFVETLVTFAIDVALLDGPQTTPLKVAPGLLYPSWSYSAGFLVMIHVCIVRAYVLRSPRQAEDADTLSRRQTIQNSSSIQTRSTTYYSIPIEDDN